MNRFYSNLLTGLVFVLFSWAPVLFATIDALHEGGSWMTCVRREWRQWVKFFANSAKI